MSLINVILNCILVSSGRAAVITMNAVIMIFQENEFYYFLFLLFIPSGTNT